MEHPIKMDDLGGKPTILGNPQIMPKNEGKPIYRQFFVATFSWLVTPQGQGSWVREPKMASKVTEPMVNGMFFWFV